MFFFVILGSLSVAILEIETGGFKEMSVKKHLNLEFKAEFAKNDDGKA